MTGTRAPLWFVFRGDGLLVREEAEKAGPYGLLPETDPGGFGFLFRRNVGELDGRPCIAAETEPESDAPAGMMFRDLRSTIGESDEEFFAMAGRAKQIVGWNRTHRFCGRCGSKTETLQRELAKKCPACGMLFHPRISPAVIMLVVRGGEVLLARSPHFPPGRYSTLAGFVEAGESVEQAVRREVREEVGVEVGDVRYFGSQSWPFPNSLMLGFIAAYGGGEIRRDPEEIEDARWFSADDLPVMPPKLTIARRMIDAFVDGEVGQEGR